jgi:3-oxoacyl-[acyl-carrier protein] reductase
MDLGIAGKIALVGGASKGLGYACAEHLAREGAHVVIVARDATALNVAADKIRAVTTAQVVAVATDITTPEGRKAALAAVDKIAGTPGHGPDILVTNAGGPPMGDFREWDREIWLKAIDGNMLTPIELIKSSIDQMIARGWGRIVNITSGSVKMPRYELGLSNGARSGLTGFAAGVARNVAPHGVTINNLLPGNFETDRLRKGFEVNAEMSGSTPEEVRTQRMKDMTAGRFGDPDEFGATCAFLCSKHAGYITGQNVLMDGGAYPGSF